jgi:hypothetical protein
VKFTFYNGRDTTNDTNEAAMHEVDAIAPLREKYPEGQSMADWLPPVQ